MIVCMLFMALSTVMLNKVILAGNGPLDYALRQAWLDSWGRMPGLQSADGRVWHRPLGVEIHKKDTLLYAWWEVKVRIGSISRRI